MLSVQRLRLTVADCAATRPEKLWLVLLPRRREEEVFMPWKSAQEAIGCEATANVSWKVGSCSCSE